MTKKLLAVPLVAGIIIAMIAFAPFPVHTVTQAALPSGLNCPSIFSTIQNTTKDMALLVTIGTFNTSLSSNTVVLNATLSNFKLDSTAENVYVQSATISIANATTGTKLLTANVRNVSFSIANNDEATFTIGSMSYTAQKAYANTLGLPIASLSISNLYVQVTVDCGANTYTAQTSTTTTIAAYIVGVFR